MTLGSPNVQRVIGVLILLAGVTLIVVTRDGAAIGLVIGVVLMVVGFWLSYVKNEIAKIRQWQKREAVMLSVQQVNHFHTFGYLKMPGLFREEFPRIEASFHEVWDTQGGRTRRKRPRRDATVGARALHRPARVPERPDLTTLGSTVSRPPCSATTTTTCSATAIFS